MWLEDAEAKIANQKSYSETVGSSIDWLRVNVSSKGWKQKLPQLASYPMEQFDYEAEDEALAKLFR